MVAEVVHAAQELAIHDQRQIAAHGGEGDLVLVVGGKGAVGDHECHLNRETLLHGASEMPLEGLLVEAQLVEVDKEAIAHLVLLGQLRLAHDRHLAAFNMLVVIGKAEIVYKQVSVEMGDGARADSGVLVVGDHVLLDIDGSCLLAGLLVQAVKGPNGMSLEQRVVAAGKDAVEDLVVAILAVVVHRAENLGHLVHRAIGHIQGAEGGLLRATRGNLLQVVDEDILGLGGEVEDHVHVDRVEIGGSVLDALKNLFSGAVFVVTLHLLQKVVVEALDAYAEAIDAVVERLDVLRRQVIGIGLA